MKKTYSLNQEAQQLKMLSESIGRIEEGNGGIRKGGNVSVDMKKLALMFTGDPESLAYYQEVIANADNSLYVMDANAQEARLDAAGDEFSLPLEVLTPAEDTSGYDADNRGMYKGMPR